MTKIYQSIIALLILFSVFSVFATIPPEDNFAKTSDEGYYLAFASFVHKNGIAELPKLAKTYVDKKEARLFPPPTRIGYILMAASWFKLFPATFVSLARLSCFCFVLFLAVSFYFSRKFFGDDTAYIFTLLLSSSPLMMAMGRRALSDMQVNLLWGSAIWLLLDFFEKPSLAKYLIFILVCWFSILVKESSIVLPIFFGVSFCVYKYAYGKKISGAYLFGIAVLPAALIGATYVIFFKGVSNAVNIVSAVLSTHANLGTQASKYAVLFCTGPWYRYIIDYILLSPVTTLLFIGYFIHKLLMRNIEWKTAYFMAYFTMVFFIFNTLKYAKIVRFVTNLDMVMALFSSLLLFTLFKHEDGRRQISLVFLAAIAIFFLNHVSFIDICVNGIYDPVTYQLLTVKKLIP